MDFNLAFYKYVMVIQIYRVYLYNAMQSHVTFSEILCIKSHPST